MTRLWLQSIPTHSHSPITQQWLVCTFSPYAMASFVADWAITTGKHWKQATRGLSSRLGPLVVRPGPPLLQNKIINISTEEPTKILGVLTVQDSVVANYFIAVKPLKTLDTITNPIWTETLPNDLMTLTYRICCIHTPQFGVPWIFLGDRPILEILLF